MTDFEYKTGYKGNASLTALRLSILPKQTKQFNTAY